MACKIILQPPYILSTLWIKEIPFPYYWPQVLLHTRESFIHTGPENISHKLSSPRIKYPKIEEGLILKGFSFCFWWSMVLRKMTFLQSVKNTFTQITLASYLRVWWYWETKKGVYKYRGGKVNKSKIAKYKQRIFTGFIIVPKIYHDHRLNTEKGNIGSS